MECHKASDKRNAWLPMILQIMKIHTTLQKNMNPRPFRFPNTPFNTIIRNYLSSRPYLPLGKYESLQEQPNPKDMNSPIVGIVVTTSPNFNLYRIVVFPAASSPTKWEKNRLITSYYRKEMCCRCAQTLKFRLGYRIPIHFWNGDLLSWYDDTKSSKIITQCNVTEFLKSLGKIHFLVIRCTKWNMIYPNIQKARVWQPSWDNHTKWKLLPIKFTTFFLIASST